MEWSKSADIIYSMPNKPCQIFKYFYAVVLSSPSLHCPKALAVFNVPPTKAQLQEIICKEVIGKMPPTGHIYTERPEVRVMPLHIPLDILYK